jgi:hypothetical protein
MANSARFIVVDMEDEQKTFLKERGFIVYETQNGFSVWVGLRSLSNEDRALFIKHDEMEVIQKLGKIARIDCSDDIRLEIIKNRE